MLLVAGLTVSAAGRAEAQDHWRQGEVVYFSCRIEGSHKLVSLCGGLVRDPETSERRADAWLQYRFGPPGKPELVFPPEKRGRQGGVLARGEIAQQDLRLSSTVTWTFPLSILVAGVGAAATLSLPVHDRWNLGLWAGAGLEVAPDASGGPPPAGTRSRTPARLELLTRRGRPFDAVP
jgi:hypothetical protein